MDHRRTAYHRRRTNTDRDQEKWFYVRKGAGKTTGKDQEKRKK